jgi:hypothetical protein
MQQLPIGDHSFHATTPSRVGAGLRPAQAERSSAEELGEKKMKQQCPLATVNEGAS